MKSFKIMFNLLGLLALVSIWQLVTYPCNHYTRSNFLVESFVILSSCPLARCGIRRENRVLSYFHMPRISGMQPNGMQLNSSSKDDTSDNNFRKPKTFVRDAKRYGGPDDSSKPYRSNVIFSSDFESMRNKVQKLKRWNSNKKVEDIKTTSQYEHPTVSPTSTSTMGPSKDQTNSIFPELSSQPLNFYRNIAYDHLAKSSLYGIEVAPNFRFKKVLHIILCILCCISIYTTL